MKARNVIVSLLLVLGMLAFIFIKIRNEPKKKLTLYRNPSRIEYSQYALCRMECYGVNANTVTAIFRTGAIERDKGKNSCPTFTVSSLTKQEKKIFIKVRQCGTVARVIDCYDSAETPCNCTDAENRPISFLKAIIDAIPA
jgi:hypothetical protein